VDNSKERKVPGRLALLLGLKVDVGFGKITSLEKKHWGIRSSLKTEKNYRQPKHSVGCMSHWATEVKSIGNSIKTAIIAEVSTLWNKSQ